MTNRVEELKRRLVEQERWGKWNTAPLANEIARLKLARMPPWRRRAHHFARVAMDGLVLILCYVLVALAVYGLF